MTTHPRHLTDWVESADINQFRSDADEFHHYFKLRCKCGADSFELFKSDKHTVRARCQTCAREVTVYDLAYYPAATKLAGSESFRLVGAGKVYMMYEYGEAEDDEVFNPDDITWCQIWLGRQSDLELVLDDETA